MNFPASITLESDSHATAVISLGSNQASVFGSPVETLLQAMERLQGLTESVGLVSSLYLSEPIDCPAETAHFINAIVCLQLPKSSSPDALLRAMQAIESSFGRRRDSTPQDLPINLPRTLDLDLICFGNQLLSSDFLTLPHPRAHQRRFVLEPLAEIAPQLVLPAQNLPVEELLRLLSDSQTVRRISRGNY